MKKVLVFTFLIMIGMGVMVNSCSKEESLSESPKSNKVEIPAEDIAIFNKIVSFQKKMDFLKANPAIKSGETISADSARWYLDAAFNLTYSFINESFDEFKSDSFEITFNKVDGEVNINDMSIAYAEMKTKTLEVYDAMDADNKELYITSFEVKENTDDHITLKTNATIGAKSGTPPNPSEWGPFADGQDWKYGEKLGDCEGNGQYETDGAIKIGNYINDYRYQHITDVGPGWHAFYSEPSITIPIDIKDYLDTDIFINTNDNTPNDNYKDYLMMYQDIENIAVHTCILSEELNFYFHGAEDVIYDIVQDNFSIFGVDSNLTFTECSNFGYGEPDKDNPDFIHHKLTITYKTRHISGGGIGSISIGEDRD